jgi:lysine 2,3-aminomutase
MTPSSSQCNSPLSELISSDWWLDWQQQISHRITTPEDLLLLFPDFLPEALDHSALHRVSMAITPYYASLVKQPGFDDPVFAMSVPQAAELHDPPFLSADPLGESQHMPVPGIIRRYPDRVVLLTTIDCAAHCRHCTRKWAQMSSCTLDIQAILPAAVEYLHAHPEIREVLVSGGDPLTLLDDTLEYILASLRAIPSIDIIRIGTRTPVTLPMRITPALTEILKRYHPVWINTHFNHPVEITPAAAAACELLADAGCPVGNQTVLLKGVNDSEACIENLCRMLIRHRVRPYYLFQCDLVPGVEHFRTPLQTGIRIIDHLRKHVSGIAIPTFVVDTPGFGGKIPVTSSRIISSDDTQTVFITYDGQQVTYPEPVSSCPAAEPSIDTAPGIRV